MLVSTFATLRDLVFALPVQVKKLKTRHDQAALSKTIISTLAYFDVFDFPLTAWEVYIYLWRGELKNEVGFLDVKKNLEVNTSTHRLQEQRECRLQEQDGFYFLRGRAEIISLRKERQIITAKKYQKARRIVRLLGVLPFIKMIAVSNSLAADNARENSDIDLFIVSKANKIWSVRFFSTLFLAILRLRPTASNKKDKICLNFFVSDNSLNLEKVMIDNDIYFIYWLRQLTPLFDSNDVYQKFIAQNFWQRNYFNSQHFSNVIRKRIVKQTKLEKWLKVIFEQIVSAGLTERILKKIQLQKMPAEIKNNANLSRAVIINDGILKFHLHDRRQEFKNKWVERIKNLELRIKN